MVQLGIYDTELKKRIFEVDFNYVGGLHFEGIDNTNWSMAYWDAQFVSREWFFELANDDIEDIMKEDGQYEHPLTILREFIKDVKEKYVDNNKYKIYVLCD